MTIKESKLKNGLTLYTVPLKSTEAVTVLVLVRAGSKYETKRINGLSHFLEHMFFKGTTKRPTPLAVAETLDRVGGEYNAFTGKEHTGYYAKVDAKHEELAIDWVSDMLLHPLFKADEIEREKGVIAQEINMYYDSPGSYIGNVYEQLLYGDQPAGWDILGTKEIISKLKRDDFLRYVKARYVANETFVVVAGNVDVARTKKLVTKYFGELPRGHAPDKVKVKEVQKAPALKIFKKETDQTHFQLGVRAFDAYDNRRYALSVLSTILGGPMSSRLFITLREEHGLAYYVSTSPDFYTDTGLFTAGAGVPNKDVVKAAALIMEEFERTRREKVSADELKKAKDYMKGKILIGLESSNAVANYVADQALTYGNAEGPHALVKKIDAVTAEDILRVAKTIFVNNKLNMALIGPRGDEAALKKVLKFKT